jgi:hypothetical protein
MSNVIDPFRFIVITVGELQGTMTDSCDEWDALISALATYKGVSDVSDRWEDLKLREPNRAFHSVGNVYYYWPRAANLW